MRWVTACVCLLLLNVTVLAESSKSQGMVERVQSWTFSVHGKPGKTTGRYLEYTPRDWDGKTPLPLVIFLHGAGARIEVNDTIDTLYDEFVVKQIRDGKTFPAIVLCPQSQGYWGGDAVEFFDQAMQTYTGKFDPDRVYLTGLSSGGGGTWSTAVARRKFLAAAVPICGIRKPTDHDQELVDLPIWAFHNVHDPYQKVQFTRDHVEAIRAAGGKYLRYTEYDATPGHSHPGKDGKPVFPQCHAQAWEAAYSDESMWTWLFNQKRGEPERAIQPEKK
jgi:predicted peptidase